MPYILGETTKPCKTKISHFLFVETEPFENKRKTKKFLNKFLN